MMSKIRKYLRFVIYLFSVLILLLPISTVFDPGSEESMGEWVNQYAVTSLYSSLFIIPFLLALFYIPKRKHTHKKLLIIFSLILAAFISYFACLSFVFGGPDFQARVGMLIAALSFPLVCINSMIEWQN
ncbi:hypothetical protein N9B82_00935 [Saprospiraceae bacterium]|nr:hypothetical protein [Saprospiraceae bacterium]